MNIRIVDKTTGRNYFIVEIGFHVPSLLAPVMRWFHVKCADLIYRFNRWYSGMKSGNGRGTYVWRDGAWVIGNAVDTSVFHTFFDYGLSRFVSSTSEIKAHEKQGRIYTTYAEAERESAKRKFQKRLEYKAKIRAGVEEALLNVARGKRSYYREHLEQMPKDMKLRAEREQAARNKKWV